jgi:Ca2+-binding RTX toxin-like protein
LYGGSGSDILQGEAGNDFLFGGSSELGLASVQDYLFGGAGRDIFVIQDLPGSTAVADFNRAEGDVISVQGTGLKSFADLVPNVNTFVVGYGVLIVVDADTQLAIFGQTLASL